MVKILNAKGRIWLSHKTREAVKKSMYNDTLLSFIIQSTNNGEVTELPLTLPLHPIGITIPKYIFDAGLVKAGVSYDIEIKQHLYADEDKKIMAHPILIVKQTVA